MTFLPIVERELRLAARHRGWWRLLGTNKMTAASAVATLIGCGSTPADESSERERGSTQQ